MADADEPVRPFYSEHRCVAFMIKECTEECTCEGKAV